MLHISYNGSSVDSCAVDCTSDRPEIFGRLARVHDLTQKLFVGNGKKLQIRFLVRVVGFAPQVLRIGFYGVKDCRSEFWAYLQIKCKKVFVQNGGCDPVIIPDIDPSAPPGHLLKGMMINDNVHYSIGTKRVVAGSRLGVQHTDDSEIGQVDYLERHKGNFEDFCHHQVFASRYHS